ncbi:MAG: hypothetical protein H6719_13090 [Sandaracinaceae bacterium]|nr:hypothetical protein [Sandaracinaceae bacterium]
MADDYESDAMPPRDAVRFRDKLVSRGMAAALGGTGALAAAVGVGVLAGIDPAAPPWVAIFPFAVAVGVTLLGLARSVVRVAVTDDEVIVDQGMRTTRIPLAAIESIEMIDVSERRAPAGWELLAPSGKGALFVGVTWRDGAKVRKSLLNGSDVTGLADHLRRARTRVRVEVDEAPTAAEDDVEEETVDDREERAREA